jgi:hypothetical protein
VKITVRKRMNTEATRIHWPTMYVTEICDQMVTTNSNDFHGNPKAVPPHAMNSLGGRGSIAPTHSRPRRYMGVSGQRYVPAAIHPPRKGPPVPIVQEAGWAPEPVWTHRRYRKILSPLPGIEHRSPGRPARSQTLYWLSYPGSPLR